MIAGWLLFVFIVALVLALDLFVFNKRAHLISFKEALAWSGVWIFLALLFDLYIFWSSGHEAAINFLTGYLIEKTLSIDNLFVMLLIFRYFQIPERMWHSVLFWGILGAIVTRALFLYLGLTLVTFFHPIIYFFGALLIFSGYKFAMQKKKKFSYEKNLAVRLSSMCFPVDERTELESFFVKKKGKIYATPLWVALLSIEAADLLFAIDSIPAILAITYDPFIVYTSNIFAILGLRALFFLLARSLSRFRYLHYGISLILIFVGLKMLLSAYVQMLPLMALGVVLLILLLSILASLLLEKRAKRKKDE